MICRPKLWNDLSQKMKSNLNSMIFFFIIKTKKTQETKKLLERECDNPKIF